MKEVLLCCKRLGLRCPTASREDSEIRITIPSDEIDDYTEAQEDGSMVVKFDVEQLSLIFANLLQPTSLELESLNGTDR